MTVATAPATLEERVQGCGKVWWNALYLNYKRVTSRVHERALADALRYSPYHEMQVDTIAFGTANLNPFVAYTRPRYIMVVLQEIRRYAP